MRLINSGGTRRDLHESDEDMLHMIEWQDCRCSDKIIIGTEKVTGNSQLIIMG
jgi:hypothetical protein